jgi:hypothetical protein
MQRASNPIVELAVRLRRLRPDIAPLKVLDVAMQTHPRRDLRLESADPVVELFNEHLDPPSPFAEVVREAFAPHMSPDDLDLIARPESPCEPDQIDRVRCVQDQWNQALDAFGDRYDLWH